MSVVYDTATDRARIADDIASEHRETGLMSDGSTQDHASRHNTDEGAMERRILVVDDSELICQQLSQLLALPDRQIAIATDGTAALEWLVEHPCSLVLTDLRLPGIQRS